MIGQGSEFLDLERCIEGTHPPIYLTFHHCHSLISQQHASHSILSYTTTPSFHYISRVRSSYQYNSSSTSRIIADSAVQAVKMGAYLMINMAEKTDNAVPTNVNSNAFHPDVREIKSAKDGVAPQATNPGTCAENDYILQTFRFDFSHCKFPKRRRSY